MSSIMEDLRPQILPKGKIWEALHKLREKSEDDYQQYVNAIFKPHPTTPGEYAFKVVPLQKALTKHTGVDFGHGRISDIREKYTSAEELPV